jgi:hypothetical protein
MKNLDKAAYGFGGSLGVAIGCFITGVTLYGFLALGLAVVCGFIYEQCRTERLTLEEGQAVENLLRQMRGGSLGGDTRLNAAESAAMDQLLERMRSKKG